MWNWLSGNLVAILASALSAASPEIKKMLQDGLLDLEKKAELTTNKFDDILVAILKSILGM
jgi:hypothetical protein